jgi:hypothetical protein
MDLEACLRRTAAHEVLHSLFATLCGFEVERVQCRPSGQSSLLWRVPLRDFYRYYATNPLAAIAELVRVVGTLSVPYFVQQGFPRGVDVMALMEGRDRAQVEPWKRRWEVYRLLSRPEAATWLRLCSRVRSQVLAWYHDVGRQKLIAAMTAALLTQGTIPGNRWAMLANRYTPDYLKHKDKETYTQHYQPALPALPRPNRRAWRRARA